MNKFLYCPLVLYTTLDGIKKKVGPCTELCLLVKDSVVVCRRGHEFHKDYLQQHLDNNEYYQPISELK